MEANEVDAVSETRLRGKEPISTARMNARRGGWGRVVSEALVVVDAVAFLATSVIHFGYPIPLGFATLSDVRILPAGIAEGAIGFAFVAAAAMVFARSRWAWNGTVAAYLLGIIGVLIGISVSVVDSGDSSRANLLFHLSVLPVLVAGVAILFTRGGRTGLGKAAGARVGP